MVNSTTIKELFDFSHKQDKQILKQELLRAISDDKVDIELFYHFYKLMK